MIDGDQLGNPEHDQSRELAVEADRLLFGGRYAEARPLYIQAADLERKALDDAPLEMTRERGVFGVRWISLLYRGRAYREAELGALGLMQDQDLPREIRWQLRDLVRMVWDEQLAARSAAHSNWNDPTRATVYDETVEGSLRGANLINRWIEIDQADGVSRRCYFDLTPLDDLIGALVNRPVIARGTWDVYDGQRRFEIREISLRA